MGDVHEEAGTVPRKGVAAAGSAVFEMFEDLDALANDLVGTRAVYVGYETNTAGVPFSSWVTGTSWPVAAHLHVCQGSPLQPR